MATKLEINVAEVPSGKDNMTFSIVILVLNN